MKGRPSDILERYDGVITIRTRIGEIPLYKMIEKFLWIENEDGESIPFILNEDQVSLYEEMCEQVIKGQPIRIDILKARRIGFSTFIAGIIFCEVVFVAGQKAAIVADIAEHASNLFEKYIYFYDHLPIELKPTRLRSNAKELVVGYENGQKSSIRIMVQGDSAGRSGTYQYLHLSECAFWDDLSKTLISLLQTVSPKNKKSMVFLETTANGVNEYKTRWDKDVGDTKGLYKACFYAWWTDKKCQDAIPRVELEDLTDWELEMMEKYNLTLNQMSFIDGKYRDDCGGDLDYLRQEYPSNPIEAFITTGNSVFNMALLLNRKEEILKEKPIRQGMFTYRKEVSLDGSQITISDIKWVDTPQGDIKIYEEAINGHPYVVCNDPAAGGEDYFATQVVNNYTGCQAAVYHRNRCDADMAAYQMYCLLQMYNGALATGETNTTSYILKIIYKCGYRFIYKDQDVELVNGRFQDKYGFKTKQNNRQTMIDYFAEAFRDNPKIIRDYDTICEMENFQIVRNQTTGNEKAQATGGWHDDLVMSMCGYYLCRHAQKSIPSQNTVSKQEYNYDPYEWHMEQVKKEKERNVYQVW